ncbi:hypothetical protein [Massilia sp. BSC265]|uniref:hypothetical protein n=1 Tax=Massilia sp. BSC265 TaxID=1549812 RepID=UPI0004E966D5|nr:hypothetical protein [Massilia sp. BSC265]KFI08924.1 hypothetical protein JN27_01915 [Massilia sp. BSC265]
MPVTADRRLAGILATVLVHAALVLGWQVARTLPPAEAESPVMQWIQLPALVPELAPPPALPPPEARRPARPVPGHPAPSTPAVTAPALIIEEPAAAPSPAAEPPARPNAASILENARRSVAGIDRALRKESKPLIIAPPDSPELRMRRGMEEAHALAPPRLWEAPKVEELVNNTGDGARRTRVITGRRTYCITERSPATNVEMIEMHGKIRLTNCPTPEEPAKRQEWRTARD